jgi:transcription antitermination protein NusB
MNKPSQPAEKSKPSITAQKKAARLMAVQAVYQMSVNKKEVAFVIDEYLFLRKNMAVDGEVMVEPEPDLFKSIVMGVAERKEDLSNIVTAHRHLKPGQMIPDEPLLNSVLICGVYELIAHQEVDSPIIISGYVEVAKAFFHGSEPSLINAILDSARKTIRGA